MFEVKSKSTTTVYAYTDEDVTVNGSYENDALTGELKVVRGTVQRAADGQHVGNFTGMKRGDAMRYALSEMSRADNDLTWDAIEAIEEGIDENSNENSNESEGV